MTQHQNVLAKLLDELAAFEPECSILLGGSLARGEEREDSDIDMHVWLPREPDPSRFNDLINEENRAHWHVCAERDGIKVDIGWRLFDALLEDVPADTAMVYYPCGIRIDCDEPRSVNPFLEGRVARRGHWESWTCAHPDARGWHHCIWRTPQ